MVTGCNDANVISVMHIRIAVLMMSRAFACSDANSTAMQTVQQCKEKQWARSLPVLLTVQWWWWKTCVSACMFGSALLTMAEASILAMQVCMQTVLQFNEGYAWKWWTRSTASLLMSLNDMSLIRVMSVRIALFRASWLIVAMQVHTYTNWAHIIGH